MFSPAILERYIWWISILLCVALYIRLRLTGLDRVYHFFAYFLLVRVARSLSLEVLPWLLTPPSYQPVSPVYTDTYRYVWMATEPLLWFFYVLVVLELYSLVLKDYKGLATLGKWTVLGGLAVAVGLFTFMLPSELGSSGSRGIMVLQHFLAVDRGVFASLSLFLLVIAGFLAWCPVPLSRNAVLHCMVYAAYFLGQASLFVARIMFGASANAIINGGVSLLTITCLLAWIFFLTPQGETKTIRIRPGKPVAGEEELVAHLAAINSTLLRAGRK